MFINNMMEKRTGLQLQIYGNDSEAHCSKNLFAGANIVMQQVKLSTFNSTSHMSTGSRLTYTCNSAHTIQLLAYASENTLKMPHVFWAPATITGDPDELLIPVFCLAQPWTLRPFEECTGGWKNSLSLLSLSLSITLPSKLN